MTHRAPIIAGVLAVALSVGFYFLLYSPKVEEREAVEAETAELEAQAASLRSEIARLREIEANRLEYEAKIARLDEHIPRDVKQPTALRQFQTTADSAGVEIETLSFGSPVRVEDAPETGEADTTLAEVSVSMSLEGGYFQLVDLLRRIEVDVPRALMVDSVSVNEAGDGFPELTATWTGRVFAVVDVAAAAEPGEGDVPEGADPDADPDAPDADPDDPDADPDPDGDPEADIDPDEAPDPDADDDLDDDLDEEIAQS